MKSPRFSLSAIRSALGKLESGMRSIDVAQELGITQRTLFRWKKRYNGRSRDEAAVVAARENARRRRKRREAAITAATSHRRK